MNTVPTHVPVASTLSAPPSWSQVAGRLADLVHAGADRRAWDDGLTVSRVGITGREYRSPLFDQLRDVEGVRREGR